MCDLRVSMIECFYVHGHRGSSSIQQCGQHGACCDLLSSCPVMGVVFEIWQCCYAPPQSHHLLQVGPRTCTLVCIWLFTCVHMRAYLYARVHMAVRLCACGCTLVCICVHTCMLVCIWLYACVHMCAYLYACVHTCTLVCIWLACSCCCSPSFHPSLRLFASG